MSRPKNKRSASTKCRPCAKKGLTTEAVGTLVLFAVSMLILLLVFGGKIWPAISPAGLHEMCKQSVYLHAGKPLEAFRGSIKCVPEHITIDESLSSEKGQEAAKARLAKAVYNCWDDYGQGKLDLFARQNVYCGMCGWIDFGDKKGKITGLTDYLGRTSVPNKKISFLDYLAGYETPHFRDYLENTALYNSKEGGAAVEIEDTSKRYAAVIVYARGEDSMNRIKDFLSPNVPGSGGREIGQVSVGVIGGAAGAAAPFIMFGAGPVGWITAGLSTITAGGLSMYTFSAFSDKPQWMAFTRIVPYEPESFKKLGCQELPVESR
ncbi:MAG: hypothetical protein AABX47_04040 [Nanoarchaeota archaeon]